MTALGRSTAEGDEAREHALSSFALHLGLANEERLHVVAYESLDGADGRRSARASHEGSDGGGGGGGGGRQQRQI